MAKKKIKLINEEFDFKLFFMIAQKNFIWIFLFLILAISSAYLYLRYTAPVFQSESIIKLSVENNANKVLNFGEQSSFANNDNNHIAGEIELIKSKVIVEKILDDIPLSLSYYAKGTVLINELYKQSPFSVVVDSLDSANFGIPFFIKFENANEFSISYGTDPEINAGIFKVGQPVILPLATFKIFITDLPSIEKQQKLIKKDAYFFVFNNPVFIIKSILSQLSVQLLNQDAQTIKISYKDKNPHKAADIVNAISNEFLKYDYNKNSEADDNILKFIDNQLGLVNTDLKSSEDKLEDFKRNNKIINPEMITSSTLNHINEIENQKIGLDLEKNVLEKIEENVNENKDLNTIIPLLAGEYNKDGIVTHLITTIETLENELNQLLLQSTEKSQPVIALNSRIQSEKKILLESIKISKNNIDEKVITLNKKIKEFESRFDSIPSKEAQFSRLNRIFTINEKFYDILLEKKEEFQITKAGIITKNLILDRAQIIYTPVSPNRTLVISSFLFTSLIISMLLIVVRYLFHNEITTLEEVEQYTEAPLLGIVPRYKKEIPVSQLLVDKNPKSIISESFRSIRTNLSFINNDPGAKIIAVTSTISGEGKTFVAINLAGVIAFSGKRVVLIDLDLRKPKIHVGFNVENIKGVSTILIKKDNIEDCIINSDLENLDFITAGPIPPNPSEMIINKNMLNFLEYLKTKYDVIIIDTPPVGIVTDGLPMIQMADYPIYILRASFSKRMYIQNINKLIEDNHIKKISVILNGVDTMHSKYGYGYGYRYGYGGYGYAYGYGYGYGYGYYEEDTEKRGLLSRIKDIFRKDS